MNQKTKDKILEDWIKENISTNEAGRKLKITNPNTLRAYLARECRKLLKGLIK